MAISDPTAQAHAEQTHSGKPGQLRGGPVVTNTGGPAFPTGTAYQGLTIRDYFAAKAMQGLLELTPQDKQQWTNKMIAETAYNMADAMLKAREQK